MRALVPLKRLRDFDLVAGWIERRYAKRASAALLDLHRRVQRDDPSLAGRPLYEAVAAAYLGSGSGAAALAVSRADLSFAQWPRERDLCFRDLVHLLVFEEYTRTMDGRAGTRTTIGHVVASIIPAGL